MAINPTIMQINKLDNILREIDNNKDKLIKLLINIASIPSPGGHEQKKIQFIKEKLQEYGLRQVTTDSIENCIAKLPAKSSTKTILIVAHTDTACDPGERVAIKVDGKYIYGHGICDNSAGITGLLTTIALIKKHNIQLSHSLIFGFTVGEEGLGAKRGMKQIIKDYGKQIDAVVNVESHPIGRVTNQAIGQYRCQLSIDTKTGGHSFRDFGRSNAIILLSQIISDFSHEKLPQSKGKTTFNVGKMIGEGSINIIPRMSSCLFEIRSEDKIYLEDSKNKFLSILDKYRDRFPDVEIILRVLAETVPAIFPKDHKIYQLTMDAQRKLGITPQINAGNTDGDVSLAAGIPTVTIGTSEGWNTHSLNEYMEKNSLSIGVKQVFMVVYTVASRF